MLSSIPFNEFYDEVKLSRVDNKDLAIMSLISFNKNLGNKQIHKLFFLTFAEGKILLPFKFMKNEHGPFSVEIRDSLKNLQERGLVSENPQQVIAVVQKTKKLTNEGEKFVNTNKELIDHIKGEISRVISEHQNDDGSVQGANSLERYCYQNYLLKPSDKSEEEWKVVISNKIKDTQTILSSREKELEEVQELEEPKRVLILSSFDYVRNILEILAADLNIDQVVRGVIIKSIQEYLDNWGELFAQTKIGEQDINKLKELLFKNRLLFRFINEVSKEYGIFESVFSEENEVEEQLSGSN